MAKAKAKAKVASKAPAKRKLSSKQSGIGLTIAEMSDVQFDSHLSRVLSRMKRKGVSMELLKAASLRVRARRTKALVV